MNENEIDELQHAYKPLADISMPEYTRNKIQMMIDGYEIGRANKRKIGKAELLRSGGAMLAAVIVFCFMVVRINHPSGLSVEGQFTEGAQYTASLPSGHIHLLLSCIVLLCLSAAVCICTWGIHKGYTALLYRYSSGTWPKRRPIGVPWYDSGRFQIYITILFSWLMFAVFVAPSTTSPWVGVVVFLLFCSLCANARYLLYSVMVLLVTAVPAWWVAVTPSGNLSNWLLMFLMNAEFFIFLPGIVLIPIRNAIIRGLKKRERNDHS